MTPAARLLARASDWGRAPSAHNTQPWQVTADGPDALVLGWHADRVLEIGDPTRRDLFLSLGCLAEALASVAADEGLAVRPNWRVDRSRRVAGRLQLVAAASADGSAGTDASSGAAAVSGTDESSHAGGGPFDVSDLLSRRTARSAYATPGVSEEQVAALAREVGLERSVGCRPGAVRLVVVSSDLVDQQLPVADRWTFDGPGTAELREWLRLDPHDTAHARDGLSDTALGLAGWERTGLRLALRPRVLAVLRRTRLTALLARTSTARPLGTVVALTAPPNLPDEAVLDLGRHLLRVWLAAGRAGLSTHPLSQLLDCPESARGLEPAWGPERTAYSIFRAGHPTSEPARSGRLTD